MSNLNRIDLFGKPIIEKQEEVDIKPTKISPFDYIKSITKKTSKVDTRDYNAYIVNLGLSQDNTDVIYANEMNKYHNIPNEAQYAFLYNATPKNRRFNKWAKATKMDYLQAVKEYYKISDDKAKEYIRILTNEQLTKIQEYINNIK